MKRSVRIAIAQINTTVGDLNGNAAKILAYLQKAHRAGAQITVFPELAITGYPPEDLLLKEKFIDDTLTTLEQVAAAATHGIAIVGFVNRQKKSIFNAAAIIANGAVVGVYNKMHLPNYGVFDEKRYFTPGDTPTVFQLGDFYFGVTICEDIWHRHGPAAKEAAHGASLIININASPYHAGKTKRREDVICAQARDNHAAIVYANLVGGQDELVFDGQSMVVDATGQIRARAAAFSEELLVTDCDIPPATQHPADAPVVVKALAPKQKNALTARISQPLELTAEIYQALVTGLKDYVAKNGFSKVVVGLSGGIDSALVAAIALDTLGKENVTGVFMPTRYSSQESAADAQELAQNLGIAFMTISIEQIYKMYLSVLEPHFAGTPRNSAEENLQARIRGNVIMALSNKFGWLVLTTGNKSEMSTGYATLYGDMAGGFAVIKDVPKTLVYKLARARNARGGVIPERIFTKEPTAELKPNQKDSDTLPPYDALDPILKAYIEEDEDIASIVERGCDRATVLRVVQMVDASEYKRRQSPPGIKITPRALGKDRRMPITNKYKE